MSAPIRLESMREADIVVNKLTAVMPVITLTAGGPRGYPTLALEGDRIESSMALQVGTAINSGDATLELNESILPSLSIAKGRLELAFEKCSSLLLADAPVGDVAFAEQRRETNLSVFSDRHLLNGKLTMTDFKNRSFNLERGGDIRLETLRGFLAGIAVDAKSVKARVSGTVDRVWAGYGSSLADRTPSVFEWLLEWHVVKVVLGSVIAWFSTLMGLILWYREEQKQ
jgi:hypothetical protein